MVGTWRSSLVESRSVSVGEDLWGRSWVVGGVEEEWDSRGGVVGMKYFEDLDRG